MSRNKSIIFYLIGSCFLIFAFYEIYHQFIDLKTSQYVCGMDLPGCIITGGFFAWIGFLIILSGIFKATEDANCKTVLKIFIISILLTIGYYLLGYFFMQLL